MEAWIEEKRGFVFDVDGTLYSQRRMRAGMLLKLLSFYAFRPGKIRELYAIRQFRKRREEERYRSFSMSQLYEVVAADAGLDAGTVEAVIRRWMFEIPLNLLPSCAFSEVRLFAERMRAGGKTVIVYSDYPAKDKLAALRFPFDFLFVSGEDGLPALKPCAEAMRFLTDSAGIPPESLLYIGDRDSKDGASARLMGMDYLDIRRFLRMARNGRKDKKS